MKLSQKGQVSLLVVIIIGIVLFGIIMGIYGLGKEFQRAVLNNDRPLPSDYVANPGECFVPPQGDPLYDEHYAKNVNNPNCDALRIQSESKHIDAETDTIVIENQMAKITMYTFLGIVLATIILLVVAIRR